jgi:hypothetical protein
MPQSSSPEQEQNMKEKPTRTIPGKSVLRAPGYVLLVIFIIGCITIIDVLLNIDWGNPEGKHIVGLIGTVAVFGFIGWAGFYFLAKREILFFKDHFEITRSIFNREVTREIIHPPDILKITIGKTNISTVRNQWRILYIHIQLDPPWLLRIWNLNQNSFTEDQLGQIENKLRGDALYRNIIVDKKSRAGPGSRERR